VIRLSVPGTLDYRDVAMRVVTAATKLVCPGAKKREVAEFDAQIVSAFGEAFNNVAIHGYAGMQPGNVDIEIEVEGGMLVVRLSDYGRSFELEDVPAPDLDQMPERGMGIFIIRSFMDEVSYVPGRPNVLQMTKHWPGASASRREGPKGPKRAPRSGVRVRTTLATASELRPGRDDAPSTEPDREPLHLPGRYAKVVRKR
jgi:serine/threonine-protein kinase RsbW